MQISGKAVKVTRQDSRHRGPEESRDAKHACSLKTTTATDERLTEKVLHGELQEGKRSQGGQKKKRYEDTLSASLKDFGIPIGSWEQTTQERSKWRGLINKGAVLYEEKSICEAEKSTRNTKTRPMGYQLIP